MEDAARYACHAVSLPGLPDARNPAWDKAPAAELKEVESGRRPFLHTEFRVLRDDAAGLLLFRFLAEDDEVRSTYRMNDEPLYTQDVFEVFLADSGSLQTYREIEVSPFDLTFTGTIIKQSSRSLDMDWDIKGMKTHTEFDPQAHQTASVWALPYAAFSQPPKPGDSWRFNVFRVDHSRRGEELQAWQATGLRNFHVPERFGWLDFQA